MKSYSVVKLLSVILFFYSNTSLANQNTGSLKITAVENWAGSDALFVWTDEATKTNPANCSYSGSYLTSSNIKDVFRTLLLSANLADKKAQLTIYGGGCGNNRPVIVAIKVLK
ncbi:hypothetical protein BM523_17885 [Alteromonas mediterranea]|uniref:hypothetical protein n=1 Tax=Alteromonas mediterranea TaxID=314275 RepID=UPI000903AA4D|nr:hypothetical protein [Alteromonas mediterranea]APD95714.1 hypothetical protein BM523_17885 [Alteromonas mediterranea]APD99348.1 hypothetical protein BM525_17910 [Alteromonas mediterranea]